jgi:hypothetical protein
MDKLLGRRRARKLRHDLDRVTDELDRSGVERQALSAKAIVEDLTEEVEGIVGKLVENPPPELATTIVQEIISTLANTGVPSDAPEDDLEEDDMEDEELLDEEVDVDEDEELLDEEDELEAAELDEDEEDETLMELGHRYGQRRYGSRELKQLSRQIQRFGAQVARRDKDLEELAEALLPALEVVTGLGDRVVMLERRMRRAPRQASIDEDTEVLDEELKAWFEKETEDYDTFLGGVKVRREL